MSKTSDKKKPATETAVKTGTVALEPTPAASTTAEPQVRIDSDVTRRIRQHARAHFKTEVCGVLIGESSDGIIDINASIEALNAAQGGTHVTFTQDAWEEIYKVKDELYPDARIVGWYHSHPGFGIFLSEHDLFIQENFFSSPGQVAWVYDPHSDDEGCFGWVAGKVARLTSVSTLYQSGDPVEHSTKGQDSDSAPHDLEEEEDESPSRSSRSIGVPLWVTVSRLALTHLTVLLAGFAIAFFFFPRLLVLLPDPITGGAMAFDYHELRSFLDGKSPAPKPLGTFDLPAATPGHGLPAAPSAAPNSSTPQTQAAPAQSAPPANPQPTPPGSHK